MTTIKAIAALVAAIATASGAQAQTTRYYGRERLVGVAPKGAATYTGTWTLGTYGAYSACSGGSKTRIASYACTGGTCDPSAKPADKTDTATCTLVCPTPLAGYHGAENGSLGQKGLGATTDSSAPTAAMLAAAVAYCQSFANVGYCNVDRMQWAGQLQWVAWPITVAQSGGSYRNGGWTDYYSSACTQQ